MFRFRLCGKRYHKAETASEPVAARFAGYS